MHITKSYFFVFLITLIFPMAATAIEQDSVVREKIIGGWDNEVSTMYFDKDGSYREFDYQDSEKKNLWLVLKGKWWVENGKLTYVINSMDPVVDLTTNKVIFEIVEIKQSEMTLIYNSGKQFKIYRSE
jgi:hypothetical protein